METCIRALEGFNNLDKPAGGFKQRIDEGLMIRPKARKLALIGVRRKSREKIGVGVNHTDSITV